MFSAWMTTWMFACAHDKFLFSVFKTNKTKKYYDIMFALTIHMVYLVMMMVMMMMMKQVVFQHVMWKLHMMQLLKYAENKLYDNAIMSHLFSEISLYIHSFLDVAVWNFSTIVFVCSCSAKFFHL